MQLTHVTPTTNTQSFLAPKLLPSLPAAAHLESVDQLPVELDSRPLADVTGFAAVGPTTVSPVPEWYYDDDTSVLRRSTGTLAATIAAARDLARTATSDGGGKSGFAQAIVQAADGTLYVTPLTSGDAMDDSDELIAVSLDRSVTAHRLDDALLAIVGSDSYITFD